MYMIEDKNNIKKYLKDGNYGGTHMNEIDIWRQAFWWIDENLKSGRIE